MVCYCMKHNCYYFKILYYNNVLPLHRLNQKAATKTAKKTKNKIFFKFFINKILN